jgi:hypothetical protein
MKICKKCLQTLAIQTATVDYQKGPAHDLAEKIDPELTCPFCRGHYGSVIDSNLTQFDIRDFVDTFQLLKTSRFLRFAYEEKAQSLNRTIKTQESKISSYKKMIDEQTRLLLKVRSELKKSQLREKEDRRRLMNQVLVPFADFLNIPIAQGPRNTTSIAPLTPPSTRPPTPLPMVEASTIDLTE